MASPTRRSPALTGGAAFVLYALHLFAIWGIAASNILMGLAALVAIGQRRWRTLSAPELVPAMRRVGWLALLFCFSVAFSYEPWTSVRELDNLLSLLPLVLTLALVEEERQARFVWSGLIAVGALLAAYGLVQVLIAGGIEGNRRIPGPFSHYQTFAGVLLLADLFALASLVVGRGRYRLALVAALGVINVALFANLTRGSWVALGVALLFLLAVRVPKSLWVVVPVLVAVAIFLPGPVGERARTIFDLRNGSNYDRLVMLDAGARMIAERPVFGLGPEMVEKRYPLYRHSSAPLDQRPHLHNSYLQIAAERGLLSLAAFVALLASSLFLALRNYRAEGGAGGPRADLHLGGAAALLAYTFAALFEDNWTDTEVQRLALFVIALPFCLHRLREDL